MDQPVMVYVEIEQHSNIKYEYNKITSELEVDRILNPPYVYPYAYGFIPDTLADDGDDLDILILTNKPINNNSYHKVYIIGALKMEDEKGNDEKVLCVLEEDYPTFKDLDYILEEEKQSINAFFSNYKNGVHGRWSKTHGFMNKADAIALYNRCKI